MTSSPIAGASLQQASVRIPSSNGAFSDSTRPIWHVRRASDCCDRTCPTQHKNTNKQRERIDIDALHDTDHNRLRQQQVFPM
jgi:hypothetical protein